MKKKSLLNRILFGILSAGALMAAAGTLARPQVRRAPPPPRPEPAVRAVLEETAPERAALEKLERRGRALFIAGEHEKAREVFARLEARAPGHAAAKYYQARIAAIQRRRGSLDRHKTKQQMLQEVEQSWQRPQVFERETAAPKIAEDRSLRDKLASITIPLVNFKGVALSGAIATLSELSAQYDPGETGINIVLLDPAGKDPPVNITLRNLGLDRVLDFVLESVGYEYDVQNGAVVARPGEGAGTRLETDFYPISRSTIIRLTGVGAHEESAAARDPFAPAPHPGPGPAHTAEEDALRHFFQRAGVPFDTVEGANLALADGQLIVTQTPRHLEKIRDILRRYSDVKQVEIETKFLEVQQSDLEELGIEWLVTKGGKMIYDPASGQYLPDYEQYYQTSNRSLATAFGPKTSSSQITVNGQPAGSVSPPQLANAIDLAAAAGALADISGIIGNFDVNVLIRALSRKAGNDLMSAPKVTVLSGKTAEIVVAQEFRYPQSFSESEMPTGELHNSIALAAGTPQDFTVRNIGVEMTVTPAVEDDNSISLMLEPRVTEFEGFVEYGGPSIAIASGSSVTMPSGFYQPIFSVRRVKTEVTIWDGATVVMGGLTRDQTVAVNDKVPVLGDIPLLGRLFQSKGESTQKRNLLIFVTANLISPGGSPARQTVKSADPGALFQNPTIITPGGKAERLR